MVCSHNTLLVFLKYADIWIDEHGLHVWQESDDELDAPIEDVPVQGMVEGIVELPPLAYQAPYETPLPPLNTPVLASQVLPSIASAQVPETLALPSIMSTSAREPSPSDAAMMKCSVQPITGNPTMASLKEKTGKHAYFEAREENKATMARQGNTYPSPPRVPSASQTRHNTVQQNLPTWTSPVLSDPKGFNSPEQLSLTSRPVTKSLWHSTGDDFLNMPQEDRSIAQSSHQPNDDEEEATTSAYQYNLWKQAKASQEDESHLHRRIGINELVEVREKTEEPQEQRAPKKRKAAAISTATPEEEMWQDEQRNEDITENSVVQPISPPASPPGSNSQVLSEPSFRPTKRMRRFAERVGYVALGGATVGAMLFGSLVLTAPSFA